MNGFVAEKIPDDCAKNLVCGMISDAVYRYARALLNFKKYADPKDEIERRNLNAAILTMDDVETFFRGKWFANLAEHIDLNISGKEIIKMIKKEPRKYCNEHGGRRRKSYGKD